MRKLLTISFIGTNYVGWQFQKNGISLQETVGDAFKKVYGQNIPITGCSRTDSGVHALKYYLHFDDIKGIENEKIVLALNNYLPEDIAAKTCTDVSDDFHARYSAKSKTYIYKIYTGVRNPFLEQRAYRIKQKNVNLEKINAFAHNLLGQHDFSSFCAAGTDLQDKVRNLYKACAYKFDDDVIAFEFSADGFLYNMVRILSGTFLEVNSGKISADDADKIIEAKNRSLAGITLPAYGLYLKEVHY